MYAYARRVVPLALLLALAACSKKPDANSPLAFVPADTPYVFANLEPTPQPVLDQWSQMTREVWPLSLGMYQRMLDKAQADAPDATAIKAARAVLDEISAHVSAGTTEQLGFKGSTHIAVFGVGILPVARLQLADPNALRAAIARVETKAGAQLPKAKLGEVEYWTVTSDKIQLLMAVIDNQLVLSVAPAAVSDDVRKQLLGITRPAKAFDIENLTTLNKRYGYTPYSSGYLDVVRLVDFLGDDANPLRRELSGAVFGEALPPMDATCKAEARSIAAKFPRIVMGYTELAPKRMTIHAQLEMEPALAKDFAASLSGAPGTGVKPEGLFDFSLALPVLKQKSFWQKQAKAVVDQPYQCADLASLNESFAKFKQSLDTTIPPPASDIAGLRMAMTKLDFAGGMEKPDVSGKIVVALNNPAGAVAMAQLALPTLKDLKLVPDGKPVALPPGVAPATAPPLFFAMNDKALAVSAGAGEETTLSAFLAAPAANESVFMRMHFSGAMYARLGGMFDMMAPLIPEEQRADIDTQKQMFKLYEKWIDSAEFSITAKGDGVSLLETVVTR
jgi:predicted regulator of Ras-like GTPase activity (Roadblock/LC7/MglB family)